MMSSEDCSLRLAWTELSAAPSAEMAAAWARPSGRDSLFAGVGPSNQNQADDKGQDHGGVDTEFHLGVSEDRPAFGSACPK